MARLFKFDGLLRFEVRTSPPPSELGRALQDNSSADRVQLQLHFGEQVARISISDLWSACCELLLQAQLVRESRLDHFIIDVEQIFDLAYDDDQLLCIFSREHVFAVARDQFADSLEHAVDEIFAATSCPGVMRIAAAWGASAIRGQPYSFRFSDSVLT